jgi:hypothetical protein
MLEGNISSSSNVDGMFKFTGKSFNPSTGFGANPLTQVCSHRGKKLGRRKHSGKKVTEGRSGFKLQRLL